MSVYRPKYTDPKTGEKKESSVWWCNFTYKRRRIQESTGQTKKTLAKDYEKRRRGELERAVAGVKAATSEERIQDVATIITDWITVQIAGKKEKTAVFIRNRCAHLIGHFGSLLICDVTEARVAEYIMKREAEGAVAKSINREVHMLSRALRVDRVTAWPNVGRSTKRTKKAGRAISEDEQAAVLKAAAANRSRYALPFVGAGIYTGFRANEVRTLRWRQLDFIDGWVRSEMSKTAAGEFREVPMLPELKRIMLAHRAWIEKKLGAAPEPEHYVFPFANRGKPVDPMRPCTNIASAWWTVRKDAGVKCRLHDLRHTYATRLLEAGATDAVVRELMGQVDEDVIAIYTHIRRGVKSEAVSKAFGPRAEVAAKESAKVAEEQPTAEIAEVSANSSFLQ